MTLQALEVENFRCIERAELEFDPRLTLITGENASGKTSLLESIFFLSCGRSFRSPHLESLIRTGTPSFMAVGRVRSAAGSPLTLGVRGSRHGSEIRLGGHAANGFAEMAAALPVQVIDPEVHQLLEGGPQHRRRFLDWGVFHVEPSFVTAWRRYQRALRQRNAALKARRPKPEVGVWDADLVEAGQLMTGQRLRYLDALAPEVARLGAELLEGEVSLTLQQGWSAELGFKEALEAAWPRDCQRGVTTTGPHRAELMVRVDRMPARDRVSRGQQKLLAASLLLAQVEHRARAGGQVTALLLDDPAAELDVDNLSRLLAVVTRIPAQLIVTALDISRLSMPSPGRMFHVEQGKVSPVLYSRASSDRTLA